MPYDPARRVRSAAPPAGQQARSRRLRAAGRAGRSRTSSGSAGWIQYWPRAISVAVSPNDIAWISGWITDRGVRPQDVGAQQPAGAALGEHLAEAGVVLHRPPVRDVAVGLHVHARSPGRSARHCCSVRPTAAICGSVNTAAGTNRWSVVRGVVGVQQVVRHDPRLVVGDVLELERRADVPQGEHAVDRGALVLVDDDPAVRVGRDAGGGQVEAGRRSAAGQWRRAAGRRGRPRRRPGRARPRRRRGVTRTGSAPEVHVPPVPGQRREPLGDGLVLAAQHGAAAADDRHRAAERREDVRELRGDVARRRG